MVSSSPRGDMGVMGKLRCTHGSNQSIKMLEKDDFYKCNSTIGMVMMGFVLSVGRRRKLWCPHARDPALEQQQQQQMTTC